MKLFRTVKNMLNSNTPTAKGPITLSSKTLLSPNIIDGTAQSGYLAGQLLVATPVIDGGGFQKSVIYIFAHSAEGAMGLIINQPVERINYASLLEGLDLPKDAGAKEIPVYSGGPVERARGFVLHSNDYHRDFTLARGNELSVTASSAILNDIVEGRGPRHAALIVGYSGWSAGQLETEIEANSWISVPATEKLMFGTENELKWATASKSLGIDMAFFSTTVGHA
jgi:putative transcriptional regulator